jgi:formylglycine-generating enzyme required for sulfatase activity
MSDRKANAINQTPDVTNTVSQPIQTRWAFLVGINSYVDNSFSNLNFCVNDVKALEHRLSRLNYTAVCLHDELKPDDGRFPNRNNIEAELTRLCTSIGKDDLLWVHFACHGTRLEAQPGLKEQPVLIARDTRAATLSDTALSLAKVEALMRQSKAKRLVLTLDACETGVEMGRNYNAPDFIKNANELAEGYALISASTAKQAAQELKDFKHGVFTQYLLQGLKGEAKAKNRSFISVNDLQQYVVNELRNHHVKGGGPPQEPTYRVEGMGDMILANLEEVESEVPLKTVEFQFSRIEVVNRNIEVSPSRGHIDFFEEELGNRLTLPMAKIPRGSFLRGSPEKESERLGTENPQREVSIDSFYIGRTLVTQSQWRAVAGWPQVKIELKPEPSHFKGDDLLKGDDLPVEQVSWFEAVEFCDRLSRQTGRQYRLPSEAEWEYACRAKTKSPFHCGETISTDLANYRGTNYKEERLKFNGFYGQGSQGKYRGQTTQVNQFNPNAFGLYDMHGNLYEWCADEWHDDYEDAPADGKVWTLGGFNTHRVLRGGSWANNPGSCRSASRLGYYPKPKVAIIGFRVVCELL